MGSFSNWNTYSEQTLEFTDSRTPRPIFNRVAVGDISNNISATSFSIYTHDLEITDVVRPDVADVKLIVDVSSLLGASVTWDTIPQGCTVSEFNQEYTLSGIDSAAIWDQIKAPTIDLPADFAGEFAYVVKINWSNGTNRVEWAWTVTSTINIVEYIVSTSLAVQAIRARSLAFELRTTATFIADLFVTFQNKTLETAFTIDITAIIREPVEFTPPAELTAAFAQSASLRADYDLTLELTSNFGVTANADKLAPLVNHTDTRTYTGNWQTKLFATNPITSPITDTGSYTIDVSVASGLLYHPDDSGTDLYDGEVKLTGTDMQTLVSKLEEIEYYPDYNVTSNTTYLVKLYTNGNLAGQTQTNGNLNYNGTTESIQNIKLFSETEFPTHPYAVQYLNQADIYIIGGGGAGSIYSGGGSGQQQFINDSSWTSARMQAASVSAGSGGAWDGQGGAAQSGSSTTATYNSINYTALGGEGSRDDIGRGGNSSTNGTTGVGGSEIAFTDSNSNPQAAGGSGAFGSNNGDDAFRDGDLAIPGYASGSFNTRIPDWDNPLLSTGETIGIPGYGYSTNYAQSNFPPDYDQRSYGRGAGAGGHAGVTNTDGHGDGSTGGVFINYFRF